MLDEEVVYESTSCGHVGSRNLNKIVACKGYAYDSNLLIVKTSKFVRGFCFVPSSSYYWSGANLELSMTILGETHCNPSSTKVCKTSTTTRTTRRVRNLLLTYYHRHLRSAALPRRLEPARYIYSRRFFLLKRVEQN